MARWPSSSNTGVTQKFKDADESLNAKLLEANAKFAAEQKEVRELVDELKKKWELVQDGHMLQSLCS